MNKLKIGDRVVHYFTSPQKGVVIDVSGDSISYKADNSGKDYFLYHYKSFRRLVKKKRECQHPHITREKLVEAWIKLNGWESSPWRVDESEMFKFLCQELGL